MTSDRQLRRRCENRLRALAPDGPLRIDALIADIVASRPRALSFVPVSLLGKPYGVWLTDGETECIWYERDTTPAHQRHIILHELCHLLCGHQPLDPATFNGPFLHIDRDRLRAIMLRSGYTAEQEREAEMLASLISERATDGLEGTDMDSQSLRLLQMLGSGELV